ncbi:PREDICTED: 39S ribosomal protein L52, mitochondrial [Polistes dominula]|uniref:Large ribosomal subunit protein mL52 n=1 Tax=Polistes dominula TaxID=743375 RepID=A0ABM1J982_POLDO|nr:PREDICTED: 39S ribosomal protein L52, mitochondrial [Polistes dominula]
MLTKISKILIRNNYASLYIINNEFHTSYINLLKQDWRMKKGLTENPNAFGPLTNKPDYTFLDGRPTPFGVKQKARMIKQKEFAKKIHKLVGEIDYAVERHKRLQQEKEEEQQQILANKLKPKGNLLLKAGEPTSQDITEK